jgi:hypothetical protein
MAERAKAHITEVNSSHTVMVSHPDTVADMIEIADARRTVGVPQAQAAVPTKKGEESALAQRRQIPSRRLNPAQRPVPASSTLRNLAISLLRLFGYNKRRFP